MDGFGGQYANEACGGMPLVVCTVKLAVADDIVDGLDWPSTYTEYVPGLGLVGSLTGSVYTPGVLCGGG